MTIANDSDTPLGAAEDIPITDPQWSKLTGARLFACLAMSWLATGAGIDLDGSFNLRIGDVER